MIVKRSQRITMEAYCWIESPRKCPPDYSPLSVWEREYSCGTCLTSKTTQQLQKYFPSFCLLFGQWWPQCHIYLDSGDAHEYLSYSQRDIQESPTGPQRTTYSGSFVCLFIIDHSSRSFNPKISYVWPQSLLNFLEDELVSSEVLISGKKLGTTQQDFCTQSWFLQKTFHVFFKPLVLLLSSYHPPFISACQPKDIRLASWHFWGLIKYEVLLERNWK